VDGRNGNTAGGVAGHFGRQVRRDRLAHGWSLDELAKQAGINAAHLSRIENGRRPPTARIADALDRVFPDRRGWYAQWLDDIRTAPEIPATFRSWSDYEDQTATLRLWTPSIADGLVQAEPYAAALIATEPGITSATADVRLKARMARQQRILHKARPPLVTLLVDESALYREVGSPEVMAGQLRHLAETSKLDHVTVQVVPAIGHAALASGYTLADDAVWCEHVISGGVFTDPETVMTVARRHDSLRAECYRASESAAMILEAGETWTGGKAPTAQAAAARASRSRRPTA
jgi:transcriptional regulator with XRE-family HTH domain